MQPERREGPTCSRGAHAARLAGACGLALLLVGCSEVTLLHPKGPIGESELSVIMVAFGLMLTVVIPVVVMALWFPRRYREGNPRGGYDPAWHESARVDAVIWLIPAIIVTVLGVLTWRDSHRLDPAVPIPSDAQPLRVEVVSMDWKWLFIYPEQGVASVNQLVIPVNRPVSFRLTSQSVMTSFFIPQLGSQVYAMAGRQSHLNLMATTPGMYAGQNQQLSGRGFADMHFKVMALTPREFAQWLRKVRRGRALLNHARLTRLAQPDATSPVTFYGRVSPGLFDGIVDSFRTPSGAEHTARTGREGRDGR